MGLPLWRAPQHIGGDAVARADEVSKALTGADAKRHRMADAIVAYHLSGDAAKAASDAGIHERTLMRWCAALGTDPALSAIVKTRKAQVVEGWADELPGALKAAIGFIRKAAEQGDPKDPKAVEAMSAALERLSETAITWKVLDVRFEQHAGASAAGETQSVPSQDRPARAASVVGAGRPAN